MSVPISPLSFESLIGFSRENLARDAINAIFSGKISQ